jgi:thioredoxin-like negative regulator of GroEL
MSAKIGGTILKASDFNISGKNVYVKPNGGIPGMLLIHADWCMHCKRFLPTFNDLTSRLGKDFKMTSIESAQLNGQTALVSALNFQGYPTICFFDQNGKIVNQYNGQRDMQSILNTICQVYHKCYSK